MEKLVNKELIEEIRGNDIKYYYVNFIYEDTNNLLNITNKIFNSNLHGSFHTVRDTVIFFNKIDATYYMNLVKGPATLEEEKYEKILSDNSLLDKDLEFKNYLEKIKKVLYEN